MVQRRRHISRQLRQASRHGRVLTATDSAELVTVLAMLSMEGEGGGGASLRTLKVTLRVAVAAPVEPACLPTGITRGGDVCKSGGNGEDRVLRRFERRLASRLLL